MEVFKYKARVNINMYFDYLDSKGNLIPISHFENCIFLYFFTRKNCRPCTLLMERIGWLDLSKHTNLVPVIVSMDNNVKDWIECPKQDKWLSAPFFPVEYRKKMFKDLKVDCLPYLCIYSNDHQFKIPQHFYSNMIELKNNIDYIMQVFDNEQYEII
jgi:hypothetical protein